MSKLWGIKKRNKSIYTCFKDGKIPANFYEIFPVSAMREYSDEALRREFRVGYCLRGKDGFVQLRS
jgi:hypothetical protein